jgi:hypothetical protein
MWIHVFLYRYYKTVQCEVSGPAERLSVFPELSLQSAEKNVCVCPSVYV